MRERSGMRKRPRRRGSLGRLVAAWLVVLAAAAVPLTATAGEADLRLRGDVALAAPPDETCRATETRAAAGFDICAPPVTGSSGGSGFSLGGLLPLVGAVILGAGLALAAAFLVLRRRAGPPLDPVDAGEWWTCKSCGRNNVVGSARCYGCGSWQR